MSNEESGRVRAFIAVRLDRAVESTIEDVIEGLRQEHSGISWTKPGNLHVTLRFLGNAVAPDLLASLSPRLEQVAAEQSPFDISAAGCGAFPNLDRPRVVWIGIGCGDSFAAFARSIATVTEQSGFGSERRPFVPHLAVGRLRDPRQRSFIIDYLRRNQQLEFGRSMIRGFALYRSTLTANGPSYTVLQSYSFDKRAA